MNTLRIETKLAEKYKYKALPEKLSKQYRQFYRSNIPCWLIIDGADDALFTSCGSIISCGYDRIVVGDYGAFIEFSKSQISEQSNIIVAPGQEYRLNDKQYSRNIKYIWLTIDDGSNTKIYFQKRRVTYADYIVGKFYVSVHEVFK